MLVNITIIWFELLQIVKVKKMESNEEYLCSQWIPHRAPIEPQYEFYRENNNDYFNDILNDFLTTLKISFKAY